MSNHVHKAHQESHRNAHHLTSTVRPFDHVQITDVSGKSHNVPNAQIASFNSFSKPGGTFVSPDSAIQSSTFNGSSNYTQWVIPKDGVLDRLFLSWVVTHTANAIGDTLTAKTAWGMIDRIEIYMGSDSNITAQIRGSDAHILWLNSLTSEQISMQASEYGVNDQNVAQSDSTPFAAAAAAGEVQTKTYKVRIPSIFNNRIFLPGIQSECRIRVYWEETMNTAKTGNGVVALSTTQLEAEFCELQAEDYNRLHALSNSSTGISHRFVRTNHSVHPFAVADQQSITQVLSSHNSSYTCALLVYFRAQALANQHTYYQIKDLSLLDDKSEKLTEILPDQSLRNQVFSSTGLPSDAVKTVPVYFLPFGADLHHAIEQGINSGGLAMSSRDRLTFTCGPQLAAVGNVNLEVVSLSFSTLCIKNGKCYVYHA